MLELELELEQAKYPSPDPALRTSKWWNTLESVTGQPEQQNLPRIFSGHSLPTAIYSNALYLLGCNALYYVQCPALIQCIHCNALHPLNYTALHYNQCTTLHHYYTAAS